nr:immunoglobulin heavy chain junction region [Macaca mulatta]
CAREENSGYSYDFW